MAIEDYQLSVIRADVLEEFGKDITNATLKAKADRKINDAQLWIAKARKDWPWRLTEYFHNTSPGIAITATVVEANLTVSSVAPIATAHLRKLMVDAGGGTPGTFGYLIGVVDTGGGTYTLQNQYLGASAVGKSFTLMEGVDALPTNFSRMSTLEFSTNNGHRRFVYKTPLEFEKIKRAGHLVGNNDYIYTIKPDPLTIDTTGMYALYYPFIAELGVVHGNYWKNIDKLVNDSDVPTVPVDDRITLLHAAYWLFSAYVKEPAERVQMYKAQALESLNRMMEFYDLGDEPNTLEDEASPDVGFIQGPAGYPRFRNIV